MKNIFTLFIFLVFFIGYSKADNLDLAVANIPDSLLENAVAVIRFKTIDYERISIEKAKEHIHFAITILNEAGEKYGALSAFYDDFVKVKIISGKIYDRTGKQIDKLKKKDVVDFPADAFSTMFSDNRVQRYKPKVKKFPYTVEYEIEWDYKGVLYVSSWYASKDYNVSVEKNTLNYTTPDDIPVNYREDNFNGSFNKSTSEGKTIFSWTVEGVKAFRKEPFSLQFHDFIPVVHLSPVEISFGGSRGNVQTWKNLGYWLKELNKGRDVLPDETIAEVKALIKGMENEKEKAKAVYEYMQSKTRYVSIQLGIGGYQPMTAEKVDEVGYGDCKALSNYTKSLLDAVGVKSIYTLIGSGESSRIKYDDFASVNQANHIILCLPFENDTTWLECTSQRVPFGFIGKFSADRYGLLITEDGGKLMKTTKYVQSGNIKRRHANITLSETGDISFKLKTEYYGLRYDDVMMYFYMNDDDLRKEILRSIPLNKFDLKKYELKTEIEPTLKAILEVEIADDAYASKAGNRLFVKLYPFGSGNVLAGEKIEDRRIDISFPYGFIDAGTFAFDIPDSYAIEYLPEKVEISSKFGSYICYSKKDGNKVEFFREFKINEGEYDKKYFEDLKDFFEKTGEADKAKLILKRKK